MFELVKLALRIATDAFDSEIQLYIDDCCEEMKGLGVTDVNESSDPQIQSAVIAYCKWKFGYNDDAARWEQIYHTKLAQLKTMTGHTEW